MTRPDRTTFRRTSNYAAAWLSELVGPAISWIDRSGRRASPVAPPEWRKALLLGAGHIGDVLYNTASMPVLAATFPNCRWFFVAARPAADVLEGNPSLAGLVEPAGLADCAEEFDAVICYDSSMAWRPLLRVWQLCIPNRVGYVHKGFSRLVTHPIAIGARKSYPAHFRDLVSQLTGGAPEWSLRPQVYATHEDEMEAAQYLEGLAFDPSRPLLACFFTSRQPSGIWPAEQFARALQFVHQELPCQSILFGAADEDALLRGLVEQFNLPSRVAAGALSLRALVSFLRRCRAAFCADSGPRHLANAAGIRVLFMPNLAVGRIETGSYLDTETDLGPGGEFLSVPKQKAAFAALDLRVVAKAVIDALR
jgi:ADP-heptose:LPS heptosyltransferase